MSTLTVRATDQEDEAIKKAIEVYDKVNGTETKSWCGFLVTLAQEYPSQAMQLKELRERVNVLEAKLMDHTEAASDFKRALDQLIQLVGPDK